MCYFLSIVAALHVFSAGQSPADSISETGIPVYADTAMMQINTDDFLPVQISDEEMRTTIMRIMHYGSTEGSMMNDPFFAPGERFYDLFNTQRPPAMTDELLASRLIQEQMERDLNNAKKATTAGRIYWVLQWLLIFL